MTTPLRHIVILGPMGVGKTTVGTLVADQLGWPFVDSDRVIEALHGKTGRRIAADAGVARLHRIEAEVFGEALRFDPPSVIAPAASVADHAILLDRLGDREVVVVALECDPDILETRAATSRHRRGLDAATALELMARRRDSIAQHVGLTIDVTTADPHDTAGEIVTFLDASPA